MIKEEIIEHDLAVGGCMAGREINTVGSQSRALVYENRLFWMDDKSVASPHQTYYKQWVRGANGKLHSIWVREGCDGMEELIAQAGRDADALSEETVHIAMNALAELRRLQHPRYEESALKDAMDEIYTKYVDGKYREGLARSRT